MMFYGMYRLKEAGKGQGYSHEYDRGVTKLLIRRG